MKLFLAVLCAFFSCVFCLKSRDGKIIKPHVETYWESWEEGLGNYASNLHEVPASPIGSKQGVNVVNIAFALPNATTDYLCQHEDPPCITAGLTVNRTLLREGIREIHKSGGYVKLAVGGETYGNPGTGLSLADIRKFVARIKSVVSLFDLDGVDLTQVRDCGWQSDCGLSEIQIELIKQLRENLPNEIISYTFPWSATSLLHKPVIENSHPYLDYIVGFRGEPYLLESIHGLGVPKNKIVWGITNVHACSLSTVLEAAEYVRLGGYGGVLTWSINSDTDHRGDGTPGECTEYQTGHPDGSFVNILSYLLNV